MGKVGKTKLRKRPLIAPVLIPHMGKITKEIAQEYLSKPITLNKHCKDITNNKYGQLHILCSIGYDKHNNIVWLCLYDCGNYTLQTLNNITKNKKVSCGCYNLIKAHRNAWKGTKDIPGKYYGQIKFSAKKRGLPVTITKEYIQELYDKQNKKCALSNLPIIFEDKSASLDRIDSKLGYIPGNVRWVHKIINLMRNNYTDEFFIGMCKAVADARI